MLSRCPNAAIGFDFCEIEGSIGYFMSQYTRQDLLFIQASNRLYVHRDVKPDYTFVPLSFIGHFGLAKQHAEGELLYNFVGSKPYSAPEIFSGVAGDESVDMRAFGILLFLMITGFMPFSDSDKQWELFILEVNEGD
jgi:serine/threonine protein kinase